MYDWRCPNCPRPVIDLTIDELDLEENIVATNVVATTAPAPAIIDLVSPQRRPSSSARRTGPSKPIHVIDDDDDDDEIQEIAALPSSSSNGRRKQTKAPVPSRPPPVTQQSSYSSSMANLSLNNKRQPSARSIPSNRSSSSTAQSRSRYVGAQCKLMCVANNPTRPSSTNAPAASSSRLQPSSSSVNKGKGRADALPINGANAQRAHYPRRTIDANPPRPGSGTPGGSTSDLEIEDAIRVESSTSPPTSQPMQAIAKARNQPRIEWELLPTDPGASNPPPPFPLEQALWRPKREEGNALAAIGKYFSYTAAHSVPVVVKKEEVEEGSSVPLRPRRKKVQARRLVDTLGPKEEWGIIRT